MKKSSEKKTALCLSEKRHNEGMTAIHLYTLQPPIPPFHKPFFAHCSIARIHSQLNRTMNRCRAPRALRLLLSRVTVCANWVPSASKPCSTLAASNRFMPAPAPPCAQWERQTRSAVQLASAPGTPVGSRRLPSLSPWLDDALRRRFFIRGGLLDHRPRRSSLPDT
jgi:hypothetical protein